MQALKNEPSLLVAKGAKQFVVAAARHPFV